MRETQKIKGLRSTQTSALAIALCEPSKLDEPGLVGMYLQIEASKPLLYGIKEALRLPLVLKPHYEIIGVPHDDRVAFRFVFAPLLLEPQVKDVMQVNVRQNRIWEPYGYGNLSPRGR